MWQGKAAADFKGTAMFKRVHGMLQAVFRARGLQRRAKGSSSDSIMPKRGLLAYEVYAEVYKQCQARGKLQAGQIDVHHLDPQDNTLASTFSMWVTRWHLHHMHTQLHTYSHEAHSAQVSHFPAVLEDRSSPCFKLCI